MSAIDRLKWLPHATLIDGVATVLWQKSSNMRGFGSFFDVVLSGVWTAACFASAIWPFGLPPPPLLYSACSFKLHY